MKDSLEKIAAEVAACQGCPLARTRTHTVPGCGDPRPEIMFIGEGPGKNEDQQGKPFVGAAGKVLDDLLAGIKLKREDVFIANVIKCRPPLNRDPLPEEASACAHFLERQIALLQPKIIILLGRHAMDRFLPGLKISEAHGKPKRKNGQVYFPIYHPAATIYQRNLREVLEKDFSKIPKLIALIKAEGEQKTEP